ncbi:MAG: preprotein translocase subunit SecA [Candidatus Hydrogenedentota bacterium]
MLGGAILKKLFGTSKERDYKRLKPVMDAIRDLESKYAAMNNNELRSQTGIFRNRLAQGETLEELLPEAFSVTREAAKRVIGLRPFDVQMLGATVLHNGDIAEMMTGEGKTLVATMPLYLNALSGKGAHLVTVNDYLARRDKQWMGPIFEFLGLTVGLIQSGMATQDKQVAYRADITYGTNNEYGFDYLRDNMAVHPEGRVQRDLNYAIVDEVDSILVDEARTPLIISGRPEKSTDLYQKVDEVVRKLKEDVDYETEEKGNHATMTEDGMERVEELMGVENLYTDDALGIVHMIEQSIKAHKFYKKDDEYVLNGNDVVIIDEFTGRMMEGRRFGDGLHQAIEAKERVPVQFETQTVASITFQNFFKLYNKLAGMTGTAMTEAAEFQKTYKLEVFAIPTNLPLIREDSTDLVFATEDGKFRYVAKEIEELHKTNRPILVGTVSIERSERLAKFLEDRGIKNYEVLNAKQHEREAAIIGNAGKPGAITIATNMAGRGTDIKLGEGVRESGGLAIIGTERHESRRIDNQLRGRSGRQGDPGSTRFYVSLEDEVARLFGGDKVKRLIDMFGGDAMDEDPLDQKMVTRSIERAQGQVETHNFEIRKQVVQYDDVMNKQRLVIYKMRQDVLEDRDVTDLIHEMIEEIILEAIDQYTPKDLQPEEWDVDGLIKRLRMVFHFEPNMDEHASGNTEEMSEVFMEQILTEYENREKGIGEEIRKSFKEQVGGDDSHIDFAQLARKRVHDLEKMALLDAVDEKWIVHLYSMDYMRDSVRMRALGQRDPLLEYKTEAFSMFQELLLAIYERTLQSLFRVTSPELRKKRELSVARGDDPEEDPMAHLQKYSHLSEQKSPDQSFGSNGANQLAGGGGPSNANPQEPKRRAPQPIKRVGDKVKPNDPCPCGSGKKHKKCCGANK